MSCCQRISFAFHECKFTWSWASFIRMNMAMWNLDTSCEFVPWPELNFFFGVRFCTWDMWIGSVKHYTDKRTWSWMEDFNSNGWFDRRVIPPKKTPLFHIFDSAWIAPGFPWNFSVHVLFFLGKNIIRKISILTEVQQIPWCFQWNHLEKVPKRIWEGRSIWRCWSHAFFWKSLPKGSSKGNRQIVAINDFFENFRSLCNSNPPGICNLGGWLMWTKLNWWMGSCDFTQNMYCIYIYFIYLVFLETRSNELFSLLQKRWQFPWYNNCLNDEYLVQPLPTVSTRMTRDS